VSVKKKGENLIYRKRRKIFSFMNFRYLKFMKIGNNDGELSGTEIREKFGNYILLL
jgi:hypothetical protein